MSRLFQHLGRNCYGTSGNGQSSATFSLEVNYKGNFDDSVAVENLSKFRLPRLGHGRYYPGSFDIRQDRS